MSYFEPITDDTAPTTPSHDVPVSAATFHLHHEIDELRSGPEYATAGHAARTLIRLAAFRVVLFVLKRRTEFSQHHTAQPIAIQMLTGRIRIALPDRTIEQAEGELQLIDSGVTHDLTALDDSAFLLSMPWSERIKRP